MLDENEPAGQSRQPSEPCSEAYDPTLHCAHTVRPEIEANVPAGHCCAVCEPTALPNVPAGTGRHAARPPVKEYLPTGQAVQACACAIERNSARRILQRIMLVKTHALTWANTHTHSLSDDNSRKARLDSRYQKRQGSHAIKCTVNN